MKWKDSYTRVRRRFLLLPRCIDGEWRWLEFATWRQERWVSSLTGARYWDDVCWIDSEVSR